MPSNNRVHVGLSPPALERLTRFANANALTLPAAAKRLLEQALADQAPDPGGSAGAEEALMAKVHALAAGYRDRDDWNEHVTLNIFQRIKAEAADLYAAATSNGAKTRINREIGRQVRIALNAEVHHDQNGRLGFVMLPRAADELIRSYTLLYRSEDK